MANVKAKGLQKIYPNGVHAVKNFDLDIADGEFLVLVGPSGCGKSTFLRMIAGLETITGGELEIGGRLVNKLSPRDRDVAMVFQSHALYPTKTVYENMALSLEMRRVLKPDIRKRVVETAELLGITDLLDRKPGQMSGGQCQRAALGRAIVREPSVFLFDEPLSNLDAKLRGQMRQEIIRLHRRLGTTFVYVTHDQIEAMTMADKIVVMDEGVIQQAASPMELYDRPANLFVAGFIGSPQMNLLPCTVRREENGFQAVIGEAATALPLDRFDEQTLEASVGKMLTLGIRPEHIRLSDSGVPAAVEFTELTGSETYLHLSHGGCRILVRVSSSQIIASEVRICLDPTRLHLFDEQGRSLR